MAEPTGGRDGSGEAAPRVRWVRWLWRYLEVQRRDLVMAFVAACGGAALSAAVPLTQQRIVDAAVLGDRGSALNWVAVFLALAGCVFVARRSCLYRQAKIVTAVQFELRDTLHHKSQRLDAAARHHLSTGQIIARVNSDTGSLVRALATLPMAFGAALFTVVGLALMLVISPPLAACTALLVPVMVWAAYRGGRELSEAVVLAQQQQGELTQTVAQVIPGIRVVRAFRQERREADRVDVESRRLLGARRHVARLQARKEALMVAVPPAGQLVVLLVGGWLALRHQVTVGAFLASAAFLAMLVAPANMLATLVTALNRARASALRVFEVLEAAPSVVDHAEARPLPGGPGELVFDDVVFGYLPGRPVLDGFTLRLAPGETVALVGASGSGRTTAAMLAARFHDVWEGAVRLDGIDVSSVTLESLHHQVTIAFEDPFLFSGTIRENITYGRPDASDEEVERAAATAGLADLVRSLPEGYGAVLGARGLGLSGGQQQRVALARALLTDPRLLILDEVTSSVHSSLEQEMVETLREAVAGRTTLLVGNRPALLEIADRVVLLADGKVEAEGTHEELLRDHAGYRALLTGQVPEPVPEPVVEPAPEPAPEQVCGSVPGPSVPADPFAMVLPPSAPSSEASPSEPAAQPIRPERFRLSELLLTYRRGLLGVLLLVLLDAVVAAARPFITEKVIDRILHGDASVLGLFSVAFAATIIVQYVATRALLVLANAVGQSIVHRLRTRVWRHLLGLSVDFFEGHRGGDLLTIVSADADAVSETLATGMAGMVVALGTSLFVIVVMASFDLVLAGVALLLLVPLAGLVVICQRLSAEQYRLARQRIAELTGSLEESLSGARESDAYGGREQRQAVFREAAQGYARARMRTQRLIATYFPLVDLIFDLGTAAMLAVGAFLVAGHGIGPAALVACVLCLGLMSPALQQMFGFFDSWQQLLVSLQRIGQVLAARSDTVPEVAWTSQNPAGAELRLEDVGFRYRAGTADVLTGVELTVPTGETLAVVGASGAGKSTLVKLIAGLYAPTRGRVLLDGLELRSVRPGADRAVLGYVPQEPFLLPVSVRENIAYGRPDASAQEVEAAAATAGAHELIINLPGGYDHVLDERDTLSAGHRQLVCLARALLADPALLLLDEVTSHGDGTVLESVLRAASGRTTVMVTHQVADARYADRIAVLVGGRLTEVGGHDELLAAGGDYTALWGRALTPG